MSNNKEGGNMADNKESNTILLDLLGIIVCVLVIAIMAFLALGAGKRGLSWVGTTWGKRYDVKTYCTEWSKVVSIEPVYEDNGKYEDEVFIVKWDDGSVSGSSNGAIGIGRCTKEIKVRKGDYVSPDWKINDWGYKF